MANLKRIPAIYLSITIGILSILSGGYFYWRNLSDIRVEAEATFEHVLKEEMHKKVKTMGILSVTSTVHDTIPSKIYATDRSGTKEYMLSVEERNKNIALNMEERGLHSILFEDNSVPSDSLSLQWRKALLLKGIKAKAIISFNKNGENHHAASDKREWWQIFSTEYTFERSAGYRNEVKITGYFTCHCWTVCSYDWSPFTLILVFLFSFLFFIYKFLNRPPVIQIQEKIVTKEVPKEIIKKVEIVKEVEIIKEVKTFSETSFKIYSIKPGLKFDLKRKLLLRDDGKEVNLIPQSCLFLELLLDAPDFTVTDEKILECLWLDKNEYGNRLSVALRRLRVPLSEIDPSIKIQRIKPNKYRLIT